MAHVEELRNLKPGESHVTPPDDLRVAAQAERPLPSPSSSSTTRPLAIADSSSTIAMAEVLASGFAQLQTYKRDHEVISIQIKIIVK
ncbi:hypothetical protein EJB05_42629 [Eragrostis curvula]|uniref:Uncharacterized protein n=1 Tax=Eragrostis curvula TaxID=38414 RepID=A0A5J9TCU3_9POAL|nr:hypothetical protein EJB05_42628 [Eragrostis curvula]TVU09183.1 hypothetical protein EJB05_42629 [Eragrostis curvula]